MKTIHLRAPATTANVGPGYDIFAMALEEPFDEFIISLNQTGKISIKVRGDEKIPSIPEDNTAGLALISLCQRKNLSCGFDIEIIKGMPSGGGLGSTGASASAAIFGANKLLGLGMESNEMVDLARMGEVASGGSPHADNVAAALLGGFILIRSYNPISVLKLDLPDFPVLLGVIRKSQRTTRGFITYEIGQEKLKDQMAHCSRVIHAIHTRDIEEFGKAVSVDHIAEPVRSASIPGYHEIKKRVLDAGAFGFNVSGGGSSVFAICPPDHIDEIALIMEQAFVNNSLFVKVVKTHTTNFGVTEIIS